MSHQLANGLIIFTSLPEFFEREASGAKPNTVRVMGKGEADRALHATRISVLCAGEPRKVDAPLTDVCHAGEICGKVLVVFSWDHTKATYEIIRGGAQ